MNRVEFLAELEQRLSGIPEEERQAAIQYYADYLADAGEENEDEGNQGTGKPGEGCGVNKGRLLWDGV